MNTVFTLLLLKFFLNEEYLEQKKESFMIYSVFVEWPYQLIGIEKSWCSLYDKGFPVKDVLIRIRVIK